MNEREILKNIAMKIVDLGQKIENISQHIGNIEDGQNNLDNLVINVVQKQDHKLDILFDGYIQNAEKLERIENTVTKQEDIILRRVK